ncbi:MAG: Mur ligase family protein [Bacillota bacterium]
MKLNKLIKDIDIIDKKNKDNVDIEGVVCDSRKVKKGFLFVCIKGFETDGHLYAKKAFDNGAKALVVQKFLDVDLPQIKVKNSRKALAIISNIFYDEPSKKMKLVGITATNGKTTTSYMVDSILKASGLKTGVIGTVAIKNGEKIESTKLTTPESVDLQKYLYEMEKNNVNNVTMEASSAAIKLKRVHSIDYDIKAFNNLSKEHIGFHKTFEDYKNTKSSFIKDLKKDGWAVLNIDDKIIKKLKNEVNCNVLTFGIDNKKADITIENLDLSTGIAKFDLKINNRFIDIDKQSFKIQLSVAGYHSVYNAVSAISIGLLLGIDIKDIQKGLNDFKGVERRFELIYDKEYKIFDDHFANVGNIDVTLKTLELMDYNSLVLIYAIRGSRGVVTNKENAEAIVKWSKKIGFNKVIASLSKKTTDKKDKVTKKELNIFKEVMDKSHLEYKIYDTLDKAIDKGLDKVSNNDVIMLAGCQGMDYGGHIILNKISKTLADDKKDQVLGPLKERVVGSDYNE